MVEPEISGRAMRGLVLSLMLGIGIWGVLIGGVLAIRNGGIGI